jgi:hypothetical protein
MQVELNNMYANIGVNNSSEKFTGVSLLTQPVQCAGKLYRIIATREI